MRNILALLLTLCPTLPALAAERAPVGLVLEVDGAVTPPVAAYGEVLDGDRLAVPAGARLTVLHYLSCDQMQVSDGVLSLSLLQYDWEGPPGRIDRRPCPSTVAAGDATPAGIVFRGAGGPAAGPAATPRVAGRPVFILTGGGGRTASGLAVLRGDDLVAALPVADGHAVWPSAEPPLAPGTYKVRVLGPGDDRPSFAVTVALGEVSRVLMVNVGR